VFSGVEDENCRFLFVINAYIKCWLYTNISMYCRYFGYRLLYVAIEVHRLISHQVVNIAN